MAGWHKLVAGIALGTLWLGLRSSAAGPGLIAAVRADDVRAVKMLLKDGTDPNERDDFGATALMHAAAFGSLECMGALLDGGADVQAVSQGGATALMWATVDTRKVRLLLDHGAAPDVRLKDGTTALVTAARRGNTDAMRLLLVRGAAPQPAANEKAELLRVAHSDHPEIQSLLDGAGIELKQLAVSGLPSLANYSVTNADAIESFLALGANPNPGQGSLSCQRPRFRVSSPRHACSWTMAPIPTPRVSTMSRH
jgi:ankyrin repeat protein